MRHTLRALGKVLVTASLVAVVTVLVAVMGVAEVHFVPLLLQDPGGG